MTLNFRKNMKQLLYTTFLLLLMSSCVTQQDWVYFQDESASKAIVQPFELRYQANDLLSINVTALDMDAARPFNLFVSSPNLMNNLSVTGQIRQQTYLVDEKGEEPPEAYPYNHDARYHGRVER